MTAVKFVHRLIRHPEVLAAKKRVTRVFDPLWRRAAKDDGPGTSAVRPSRPAFGGHLRMTGTVLATPFRATLSLMTLC